MTESDSGRVEQVVNYQVYTLFNDKLGLIQCTEFNFTFEQSLTPDGHSYEDPNNGQPSVTVLVRGQKQLLLSKSLIDGAHWDKMKDFKVFSYISPASKKVVGSQLIFELSDTDSSSEPIKLNLIEDEASNLYNEALETRLATTVEEMEQEKLARGNG